MLRLFCARLILPACRHAMLYAMVYAMPLLRCRCHAAAYVYVILMPDAAPCLLRRCWQQHDFAAPYAIRHADL